MKNFFKKKGIIEIGFFLLLFIKASISSFVGASTIGSGMIYTGTVSDFLNREKNIVSDFLDTTYQKVYDNFQNSGLKLMQTLDYQSLLCLGVIKQDESLLHQIQNERQKLKNLFFKDFLDIENQNIALEEKNRIQAQTNISMFPYGTSYESEKAKIVQKIQDTKNMHIELIKNFETTYLQKSKDFVNTIIEYSKQNTGLLNFLNEKISKIQTIEQLFNRFNTGVYHMNTLLLGTGIDFLHSAQRIKSGFMEGLDMRLQPLVDAAVQRYKRFSGLQEILYNEKKFLVLNYGLDFDEQLSTLMSQRYDKKTYEEIKSEISKFKNDFFTSGQLNCTKIYASPIAFENKIDLLTQKLQTAITGIEQSLNMQNKNMVSGGLSSGIVKEKLMAGFVDFNKKNLNKKILAFKKIIRDKVSELAGITKLSETTNDKETNEKLIDITTNKKFFTRPFKKGEKGEMVKVLQSLLKNNGYYQGDIDGIFSTKTIEAVYQFQLNNELLKGYEKKPETWGWLGPSTRKKLNEILVNTD